MFHTWSVHFLDVLQGISPVAVVNDADVDTAGHVICSSPCFQLFWTSLGVEWQGLW